MFRPLKLFNRNTVKVVAVNSNRTKIIFSEAFLDRAQRIKLWNLETKQLFGAVIEVNKANTEHKTNRGKVRKVTKTKAFKQHTEVLVPFSLFASPKELKKEAIKKTNQNIVIDSKLNDLISSQKLLTEDIQLQINNVYVDTIINKNSTVKNIENLLFCSGLPLEKQIKNTKKGLLTQTDSNVPSVIMRNLRLFPMLCVSQRTLPHSASDEADNKIIRIASTPANKQLPSVTRILEKTMSPESRANLEKWKEQKVAELGVEGFEKFSKGQLDTGSKYHDVLSKYIAFPLPDLLQLDPNLKGLLSSVGNTLKNVKQPRAIESHVVHPVLKYQGVIDCIAYYQNKPTLIEWKTSNRPKPSMSMLYDNPVQLAAYFGAISHDPNYKGLNVRDAILVIAYTDGSPADIHHLTIEKLRQHWAEWLSRLEKYWTENKANGNGEKLKEELANATINGNGKKTSSKG